MSSEEFRLIIENIFFGILLFQFLYNFIIYKHFADRANLYYSFYVLVIASYFVNLDSSYIDLIKPNEVLWEDWDKVTIGIFEPLIYIAYFFFAKSFLESKKNSPKVNLIINIMIFISTVEIIVPYILLSLGYAKSAIFVNFICKPINISFAAYTFFSFYKEAKINLLTRYVFIGGIFILLGNIFYHTFKILIPSIFNNYFEPYDILRFSFILDILVFSSGLAYKYRYLNKRRLNIIGEEIDTLAKTNMENKLLEQNLDDEIKEKVLEIEQSNKLLLEKKITRELLDLQRDLLRAQMNPHFLFNSLSSVKAAIIEEKLENASKYLSHYVQMLRNMIIHSNKQYVSIEDEYQSLSNYLELEKARFNNELLVEINLDNTINPQIDMVSPMLIQPFVENSLWHGLKPKKSGTKKITISIKKSERKLIVEILDNGIGRRKHITSLKKHKSRSLSIIEKRMALLKKMTQTSAYYTIKDLRDKEENPLGTLVVLYIPQLTNKDI